MNGAAWHDETRSLRVEMSAADFELLEQSSALFGVGKSDLVRRLVRASLAVGPAFSTESVARIEDLACQVRIVERPSGRGNARNRAGIIAGPMVQKTNPSSKLLQIRDLSGRNRIAPIPAIPVTLTSSEMRRSAWQWPVPTPFAFR